MQVNVISLFSSHFYAVMEVATGEYGEAVHDLVMTVSTGKLPTNLTLVQENENSFQLQGIQNVAKTISNDICKTSSPSKLPTVAKQSSADELSLIKLSKGDTVINIANNEDAMGINKVLPNSTCTTSLLESNESVITLPNKGGFPTSGYRQFWILLKRAFLTIIRDKQLTQMRLVSHIVVGSIIGMIYYDIGNEASKVMSNAGCIFFTTLFTMFTAMMPTILTCKHQRLSELQMNTCVNHYFT